MDSTITVKKYENDCKTYMYYSIKRTCKVILKNFEKERVRTLTPSPHPLNSVRISEERNLAVSQIPPNITYQLFLEVYEPLGDIL